MLKTFYEDVLPRQGNLCLLTLPNSYHHWATSIDQLVTMTAQVAAQHPDNDLYFATAGFKTSGKGSRKQENADMLRCLRVDLDAGPEKIAKHGPDAVYADQRAAVQGLMQFAADTKLVPTWIVSSGVGLHVYWTLGADLEAREWQPLADSLKELCRVKGLKADPTITADSSRVLRPIGTVHRKSGSTVSVLKHTGRRWTSHEMRAALSAQVEVAAPGERRYQGRDPFSAMGPTPVFGDTSINADAMPVYEPSDANLVADNCAVMGHIRHTGGQVQEPLWHAMMGVVKYTVQGDEAAHAWSEGDARYDPQDTQRKYDQWDKPPTSCKHISDHSPLCRTCPHAGNITTPVELGRAKPVAPPVLVPVVAPVVLTGYDDWAPPPTTEEPWVGHMPENFLIKVKDGKRTLMARVQKKDDDGKAMYDLNEVSGQNVPVMEEKLVTPEPFWITGWGRSDVSDDQSLIEYKVLHLDKDTRPTTYTFEQTKVANSSDLNKELFGKGVMTKEDKLMRNYVMDSITLIKGIADRPRIPDRMGVRYLDDGTLVAVHGRHVIYPDRTIRTALVAGKLDTVANNFALPLVDMPSGLYPKESWSGIDKRAAHYAGFLSRFTPHPKVQLAIMLGIASPMLAFVSDGGYRASAGATLPGTGLTVSLYSRSSARGKTTAAQVAMLAYGHPGALAMGGSAVAATEIAQTTRMSQHGTMPMFVDEVGQGDPKRAADLIDMVANGSARARGTKQGGVNDTIPWSLITLITTNVSARMMVNVEQKASDAIQARLLEIDMGDVPDYSVAQNAAFRDEWPRVLSECHGALGAVLYRELVALPAEERDKLVKGCIERARTRLGVEQSGRFAYRALAAVYMVLSLMTLAKIKVPFDMPPVLAAFKESYEAGLQFVETNTIPTNPCEALSMFVHENVRNTLVTNILPVNGTSNVIVLNQRLPDTVHIRYARESKVMLVSVDAFRDWCQTKKLDVAEQVRLLAGEGVLKPSNKGRGMAGWSNNRVMTGGVPGMAPSQIMALTIYVDKLQELLGEEVVPVDEPPPPSNVVHLTR